MARVLVEAPLTTASARTKLDTAKADGAGVYWRKLDVEAHLGYRKGRGGGTWLVRWRESCDGGFKRKRAPIGPANDQNDKPTDRFLTFQQAEKKAREIVADARKAAQAAADGPPVTVAGAVEAYIADRDARDSKRVGRPTRSDAGQRLRRYVLGQDKRGKQGAIPAAPLATVPLHRLSERDLISWRETLPDAMKATTRQRTANDLKAALNAAWPRMPEAQKALNALLPSTIKAGLKAPRMDDEADAVARDNQILTQGQVAALIRAAREIDAEQDWHGDLFRVVLTLAATGARYAQIIRMTVGDVQIKERRLMVPGSYKGRGGKRDVEAVPVGPDVIEALLPAVTGRPAGAPLFERVRYEQESGSIGVWKPAGRGPWRKSELTRPWADIRRRAGLPGVITYALRHTSIVHRLKAGLPIQQVAKRHNTSAAMIERHYGKYISSALEDLERAAIVPLVPDDEGGNVIQMHGAYDEPTC